MILAHHLSQAEETAAEMKRVLRPTQMMKCKDDAQNSAIHNRYFMVVRSEDRDRDRDYDVVWAKTIDKCISMKACTPETDKLGKRYRLDDIEDLSHKRPFLLKLISQEAGDVFVEAPDQPVWDSYLKGCRKLLNLAEPDPYHRVSVQFPFCKETIAAADDDPSKSTPAQQQQQQRKPRPTPRQELVDIYTLHNPRKLDDVDRLISDWSTKPECVARGGVQALLEMVRAKYGVTAAEFDLDS